MLGLFEFLKMAFTNGFDGYVKDLKAMNNSHRQLPTVAAVVRPPVSDAELQRGAKTLGPDNLAVNEPSDPPKNRELRAGEKTEQQKAAVDSAKVIHLSYDKYKEAIRSEYARNLSTRQPEEIYDHYNPGPTNPDGSVNFECHCVGHMVASPCGAQFRRALTCQRVAGEAALERGECADEFMAFVRCAVDTNCFRAIDDNGDGASDGGNGQGNGNGNGESNGKGQGQDNGNGQGQGSGNGNGQRQGNGNQHEQHAGQTGKSAEKASSQSAGQTDTSKPPTNGGGDSQ